MAVVENNTYRDPKKVISWIDLSLWDTSLSLKERFGINAGKDIVSYALEELGYSKQMNQKMLQVGSQHVDWAVQFRYIKTKAQEFIDANEPVISQVQKRRSWWAPLKTTALSTGQ